jgi:creatinine amidohydrolase
MRMTKPFPSYGGHAGRNETAFIQAIDPTLVHPERYTDELTTAYPAPNAWSAFPFPSSIGLYTAGQGYPKFDQKKADEYFAKVNEKVANLNTATFEVSFPGGRYRAGL